MHRWKTALLCLLWLGTGHGMSQSVRSAAGRAECIGYYTVQLPDAIEYASYQNQGGDLSKRLGEGVASLSFSNGDGVRPNKFYVDDGGVLGRTKLIQITQPVIQDDLMVILKKRNIELQKYKIERLEMAKEFSDLPDKQKDVLEQAENIYFYESFNNGTAIARPYKSEILGIPGQGSKYENLINLLTLVDGRIVDVDRANLGSSQKTIDTFHKAYSPRAVFDVPTEPGVCLPYGFMRNEKIPAEVSITLRLKSQPSILIHFEDKPVATGTDAIDAKQFMKNAFRPGRAFANDDIAPMEVFDSVHEVAVDGRKGLAGFAKVAHIIDKAKDPKKFRENWGYIAYVPGDKTAAPGMSSDLILTIERDERFANKEAMTKKEFRELAINLLASIKRRPSAWKSR